MYFDCKSPYGFPQNIVSIVKHAPKTSQTSIEEPIGSQMVLTSTTTALDFIKNSWCRSHCGLDALRLKAQERSWQLTMECHKSVWISNFNFGLKKRHKQKIHGHWIFYRPFASVCLMPLFTNDFRRRATSVQNLFGLSGPLLIRKKRCSRRMRAIYGIQLSTLDQKLNTS